MINILSLLPIYTNRLVIKQTTVEDIDLILKMDKQSDTQMFLGGVKDKSKDERIEFLNKKNKDGRSLTVYLDDIPIGFIGIKIEDNMGEVSYIFDSDYTGMGYCSEVLKCLIDISFNDMKLDKLFAFTKEDNIASQRVLLKNNFIKKDNDNNEFIYFELKGR